MENCTLQLNLSITAVQWRSKKWPLLTGDLYIEGPSSVCTCTFIYFRSYKTFSVWKAFSKGLLSQHQQTLLDCRFEITYNYLMA